MNMVLKIHKWLCAMQLADITNEDIHAPLIVVIRQEKSSGHSKIRKTSNKTERILLCLSCSTCSRHVFQARGCPSSLHIISSCGVRHDEGCQEFLGGVPGQTNTENKWHRRTGCTATLGLGELPTALGLSTPGQQQ